MDNTAELIVMGYPVDAEGNPILDENGEQLPEETTRTIYVTERTAYNNEINQAALEGLKLEYKLETFLFDYDGETEIEYQGKRFSIYRATSKPVNEIVELLLTTRVGVSNGG